MAPAVFTARPSFRFSPPPTLAPAMAPSSYSALFFRRRGQRQRHAATTLRSVDRLRRADGDGAVMDLGDASGQGEAESEAARGSSRRPRPIQLVERRQHALALLRRNAGTVVAHGELDRPV